MRHPAWYRALAAVWGVWFAAAFSFSAADLGCPMHDGRVAAPAPVVAHHMASHGAHAMHDAAAPAHPDHHAHHCCTCLGLCCCAAPVATPVGQPALTEPRVVDVAPVAFDETATPVARVAHALPFANGPPAVAAL